MDNQNTLLKFLIDSCIFIDFFADRLSSLEKQNLYTIFEQGLVSTSVIVCHEVLFGIQNKKLKSKVLSLFEKIEIIPVTIDISILASEIRKQNKNLGHNLSLPDSLIAASAQINNYWVITNNKKDFSSVKAITLVELK